MTLLSSGASVDDRDATQQTALHHAVDWNNIEVNKTLIEYCIPRNTFVVFEGDKFTDLKRK